MGTIGGGGRWRRGVGVGGGGEVIHRKHIIVSPVTEKFVESF